MRWNVTPHRVCVLGLAGIALGLWSGRADANPRLYEDRDVVVWWEDGSVKVPRSVAATKALEGRGPAKPLQIFAALDEYEPFQLVVAPKRAGLVLDGVDAGALQHERRAAVIDGEHVRSYFVGYVNDVFPDVLMPADRYPMVRQGENYNLWMLIHIPRDASAGNYVGEVRIRIKGKPAIRVAYHLHVWDFALPRETHVFTQFFAINRFSLASRYRLNMWTPEYERFVERVFAMLAERRVSPADATPIDFRVIGLSPKLHADRGGQVARFGGREQIDVLATADQTLTDRFTVMVWLKAALASRRAMSLWSHIFAQSGVEIGVDTEGHLYLKVGDGATLHEARSRGRVGEGWHHVAVSFDRGVTGFFIDGRRDSTARLPTSGARPGWYSMSIGREYRGDLDDFRAFRRPMDEAAVRELMGARELRAGAEAVIAFDFETDPTPGQFLRALDSDETVAYYAKWARYWRDKGLFLGQLYVPTSSEAELVGYLRAYYPTLKDLGVLQRLYIRLPRDEALTGPGAEENLRWAPVIRRLAPGVLIYATFGKPRVGDLAALSRFGGLIDVWSYRATVERQRSEVSSFFDQRRVAGEHLSWYIHDYMALDVPLLAPRLFFWRMMMHDLTMCTWWSVNHWDRPAKDGIRREKRTVEVDRGFSATHDGGVGPGNGVGLWPGREELYPSLRLEAIREGIEDFEYRWMLKDLLARLERNGRAGELWRLGRTLIAIPPSVAAMSSEPGALRRASDPEPVKAHRRRMAEAIEQLVRISGQ